MPQDGLGPRVGPGDQGLLEPQGGRVPPGLRDSRDQQDQWDRLEIQVGREGGREREKMNRMFCFVCLLIHSLCVQTGYCLLSSPHELFCVPLHILTDVNLCVILLYDIKLLQMALEENFDILRAPGDIYYNLFHQPPYIKHDIGIHFLLVQVICIVMLPRSTVYSDNM